MTSSVTLAIARIRTDGDAEPLGREPRREPAGRVLEVLGALERHSRRAEPTHLAAAAAGPRAA